MGNGRNCVGSKWGSYLSACVLFGRLTGRDPRALGGGEAAAAALGIAPAEATALQEVAYQQLQVGGELPTTSFTLVDADTDQDVQALANGAVLNLATLPSRNLNIRANVNTAATASVVFNLNGAQTHTQTENVAPYALFSDVSGNYNPWTPAVGSYTLRATPYAASNGGGTAGQALSVNFSVTDAGAGPFVLNTSVFGGGTLTRSLDQATYPVGTVVTLTATPAAGFSFTGWSGSATGAANPLAVTMDGNKNITATFTAMPAPNQAPVLAAIGNRTATAGQALTFTATATDPDAGQVLTFALAGPVPAGAVINASTGAFGWTPAAAGSFALTVRVSDNGSPVLTDEETVTVTVSPAPAVNQAPVLAAIGSKTATVGQALTFTASATDANAGQTKTFSLETAPLGATINASSGAFSWTPGAGQVGSFAVTVRVADNGSPVATDEETLTISVSAPANQAPVLAAIGNKTATVGQALTFTATATDPNGGQALTYSLIGPPAGASINPTSGLFSWTPAATGSFAVTVRVADNGSPVLTDDETLTVTVNAAPAGGAFAFYRAVNLGGPALALDGNAWAGSKAPNFTTNGSAFTNSTVVLVPATDAARAGMIRNAVYRPGSMTVAFTAVPAGTYRLYAYAWEDNNPETFGLALNGQSVLSNASTGPAGTWRRLGPYQVTLAAAGAVTLTSSGGTVNLSGVELWQQTGAARPAGPAVASGQAMALRAVLFPNPTTDGRLWVQLTPDWAGEVRYELHSVLGALVATGTCAVPNAAAPMALDLSRHMLATGMYHLRLGGKAGQQVWLRVLRE